MKKLLSLIVAAVLVLSMLPMGAMAEAAQKAPSAARTETITGLDEGVKAPEPPTYRESPLTAALNAPYSYVHITFTSEGDYTWDVLEEGERLYAQSGNAGVADSSSTVTATFTIDADCFLTFDYKAWGEGGINTIYDKCIFTLDGTAVFTKGQEQNDWTTYYVEEALPAGEHTIEFTYSKDFSVDKPGDYFAIDEVKLEAASNITPTLPPTPTPTPTPEPDLIVGCYFESRDELDFWSHRDVDEDGHWWDWFYDDPKKQAYEGAGLAASDSVLIEGLNATPLEPDNYLIGGPVQLLDCCNALTFYAAGGYEHFEVLIGTTNRIADMSVLIEETVTAGNDYVQYSANLDDYAGEEIYIAFRHFGDFGWNALRLDQVEFWGYDEPQDEVISAIEILDFVEPAWGAHPYFGVTVPDDAHYSIEAADWHWYTDNDGGNLQQADMFVSEEALYYMSIYIVPDEGYTFSEETAVTINGDDAFVDTVYSSWHEDEGRFYVYTTDFAVEFETIVIDSVSIIMLTEPAYGAAPDYDAEPEQSDEPYFVESIEWYCGEELMQDGDVFDDPNAEYYAVITLGADEGYVFADVVNALVRGSDTYIIDAYPIEGGTMFVIEWGYFTVEEPLELIDTIEILDFIVPEWGAAADYGMHVPEGANYRIESAYWEIRRDGSWADVPEGELFDDESAIYRFEVLILPNEGYKFADEAVCLINGGTELLERTYPPAGGDPSESIVFMTIEFTVENPILWGDADGDGDVETADALLLMRYLIGLDTVDEENLAICDVNGDGDVSLADALLIMRKAMGTIEAFPIEN